MRSCSSVRWSRSLASAWFAALVGISACSSAEESAPTVVVEGAAVSLAADGDGGFLWATQDGTVHDQSGDIVASVDAVTDGQRGLLGLAIDGGGRVFVAYTDGTLQLVVSELSIDGSGDAAERIVWRGPTTVQGGNGGRMIARDDELVIGVGLLNDREGQADPESIVGKIIAIDPDAEPEQQRPRILSGPWNNPFAFAATPSGDLWVADNHPRDGDERVARGDQGLDPEIAVVLPADSAPAGLAASDEALFVCSYNSLELLRYDLLDDGLAFSGAIADDCLLDVERLADGSLVYSTGSSIVQIDP